jgi:hypothetical protein
LVGVIEGNDLALTGKTAFKLFAQLLCRRSVPGTSTRDCGQQQKQEGLHPEMLMSLVTFAREEQAMTSVSPE